MWDIFGSDFNQNWNNLANFITNIKLKFDEILSAILELLHTNLQTHRQTYGEVHRRVYFSLWYIQRDYWLEILLLSAWTIYVYILGTLASTCLCIYILAYIYVQYVGTYFVYVVHTHLHAFIHTCTHTHIYTYIHTDMTAESEYFNEWMR